MLLVPRYVKDYLKLNLNISSQFDLKKIYKEEKIHMYMHTFAYRHTHRAHMALIAEFKRTEKMMHFTQHTWITQQLHGSGRVIL